MIEDRERRLIVNINDLRKKNPVRCAGSVHLKKLLLLSQFLWTGNVIFIFMCIHICRLLNNCFTELLAFQRAVKEYAANIDPTYAREFEEFFIGFEGNFGSKHVTPRTLTSCFLGNLICVEGIVSKCRLIIVTHDLLQLLFK